MDNKESKEEARDAINSLLSNDFPNEIRIDNDLQEELPAAERPRNDFGLIKSKAETKAKKTLNSLLKFYLSEEIIEQEEYIQSRANLELMGLSKLIYLMETCESAITTLMQMIDNGDLASRTFEVLGSLQKTLLEVIKSQTVFLMAAEENAKKMAREIDVYGKGHVTPNRNNQSQSEDASLMSRGTKDLMKKLRAKSEDAQEIKDDEDEEGTK